MNQKEKIKKYIKENTDITNKDVQTIIIIERITNKLEEKGLINFSFNEYTFVSENECWLQCEYMSKIGKAIIFDCAVVEQNWNTIDEFVDNLIKYDKEIEEFEDKIQFDENYYEEFKTHIGHKIVCIGYRNTKKTKKHNYDNISIECETCMEVLADYDKPKKTKTKKTN
jgi:hypothetical protein